MAALPVFDAYVETVFGSSWQSRVILNAFESANSIIFCIYVLLVEHSRGTCSFVMSLAKKPKKV